MAIENTIQEILQQIDELKKIITLKNQIPNDNIDWVTEDIAMEILKKKKTSLFNLRKNKEIISSGTRPVFYSKKSLYDFIEKGRK